MKVAPPSPHVVSPEVLQHSADLAIHSPIQASDTGSIPALHISDLEYAAIRQSLAAEADQRAIKRQTRHDRAISRGNDYAAKVLALASFPFVSSDPNVDTGIDVRKAYPRDSRLSERITAAIDAIPSDYQDLAYDALESIALSDQDSETWAATWLTGPTLGYSAGEAIQGPIQATLYLGSVGHDLHALALEIRDHGSRVSAASLAAEIRADQPVRLIGLATGQFTEIRPFDPTIQALKEGNKRLGVKRLNERLTQEHETKRSRVKSIPRTSRVSDHSGTWDCATTVKVEREIDGAWLLIGGDESGERARHESGQYTHGTEYLIARSALKAGAAYTDPRAYGLLELAASLPHARVQAIQETAVEATSATRTAPYQTLEAIQAGKLQKRAAKKAKRFNARQKVAAASKDRQRASEAFKALASTIPSESIERLAAQYMAHEISWQSYSLAMAQLNITRR